MKCDTPMTFEEAKKRLGIVDRKQLPMTNEEYIKSCSTEQLVQVIHLMTTSCYVCGKDGVDYKRCYFHKKCTGPKEIEEWLKEPHDFYE